MAIPSYTRLYRAIHSNTELYTDTQSYTHLYRAIHSCTELYAVKQNYEYWTILSYIEIYTAIQGYT